MEKVQLDEVQIDRCTKCGGLWFDEFELVDLQAKQGSGKLDTGRPDKSTQRSQLRLSCPKCNSPMLRMVDSQQPHIWYETCSVCGGSFLDAGEFKNMVQHNFIDRLKDLLMELRGGRSTTPTKLSPAVLRQILQ